MKPTKIKIHVKGIPPHKDLSRSIRNPKHPKHNRFIELRKAAKKAMKGERYHKGKIEMKFHYVRKHGNKKLHEYLSGVSDTLDGSHGFTFHWVPIVFLDDCQVYKAEYSQEDGEEDQYFVEVFFL